MKAATPTTPREVRDLMRWDLSLTQDCHLLAILLAIGAVGRRRGRPRKSRSSLELAETLFETVGGTWAQLVQRTHAGAVDFSLFGIGPSIGARLLAGVELSRRWRRGFRNGGGGELQPGEEELLQGRVFQGKGKPSNAELIAVALGGSLPDVESAARLVEAIGSPRRLVATLTLNRCPAPSLPVPRCRRNRLPSL